jgi:predicted GNAT superfamily acetyltransferase
MGAFADNARILLAGESYPGELLGATHALREEFTALSGVGDEPGEATALDAGVAISPGDAARCLTDFARTVTFLRGIRAAIHEARRRFAGQRIRVLYAGCGPWAPLALPLCTEFRPEQVGFILVDIHERSIEAARRLVAGLDLDAFVIDAVQADATKLRLDEPFHVVVAEVMQQALAKEPQFAVTANLAAQLPEGGLFIPERIRVEATAADVDREFALGPSPDPPGRLRREVGTVMDLSAATVGGLAAAAGGGGLAAVVQQVPALDPGGIFHLMLRTHIDVFGEHRLDDYDSALTWPKILHELGQLRGGERLGFRYRTGPEPGFAVELQAASAVREIEPRDHLAILALNLQSEHLLSPMNGERLKELLALPGHHRVLEEDGQVVAFLVTVECGTGHDSENYRWFAASRDRFLYVDRVVVAEHARGRGHAGTLYDQLFAHARSGAWGEVVCEYNLEPLNEASRDFHASRGFVEVGRREAGGRVLSMQSAVVERS